MTGSPSTGSLYDVIIAGAGIGGLCAAYCLSRKGFRVLVLERGNTPLEVGAGIQLGPNATRVLRDLGILDPLLSHAVSPDAIAVRDGLTGKNLARIPLSEYALKRYGAPYLVVHRADLHRTLYGLVASQSRSEILHGADVRGFTETGEQVDAELADGSAHSGRILIGADGLRSVIRRTLHNDGSGNATGEIAWRSLVPMEAVEGTFAHSETGLWIAPGGHVVHYPVRARKALNIVAISTGETEERGWSAQGDPEELKARFSAWAPQVRSLLERADDWRIWPLFDRAPSHHWGRGRVTLLGDAAHPMLPYLAQGGAMAIEDAYVLADCLAENLSSPEAALEAYEDKRRDRTARVQAASRENARTFHADGGFRFARNTALGLLGRIAPGRALTRYDWLYGYDATA